MSEKNHGELSPDGYDLDIKDLQSLKNRCGFIRDFVTTGILGTYTFISVASHSISPHIAMALLWNTTVTEQPREHRVVKKQFSMEITKAFCFKIRE